LNSNPVSPLCSQRANWRQWILENDDHCDYRRRASMTTLARNPADPAGSDGISDCKPDDKIQRIIPAEDMMHCTRLSGKPVGVRRRPIL
jgi:hypothetical protein